MDPNVHPFKIDYLANRPDCIEACAAWDYGCWGVQQAGETLEANLQLYRESRHRDAIPLTLIATHLETNRPVAMGSLWDSDGAEWSDKTPWIASVFVLYRYRGLGLGTQLIHRLEEAAKAIGFTELYLKSGSSARFYPKLGYQVIDKIQTKATAAGSQTLFMKRLQ